MNERKSGIRRLEQKRAEQAWRCIQDINNRKNDFWAEYRGTVKKVPSLILTNGLGQTLAYLKSKGGVEGEIYNHLQEWLCNGWVITWWNGKGAELIDRLMRKSSNKYRMVTREALLFLTWLKRFADAVLPK